MKNTNNLTKRGRMILPQNAPKPELELAETPKSPTFLIIHGRLHMSRRQGVYRPATVADYGVFDGAKATFYTHI